MSDILYIFTSDKVGATGECSFKFIFDADPRPPAKDLNAIMDLPFGYIWVPEDRRDDPSYSYNVWEQNGKGLVVGGGWAPQHDTESWRKQMLDALPSCALLMTTAVFEWLKEHVLEKYDRPYKRFHSQGTLLTA